MKTFAAVAVAIVALTSTASAKKKVDFTPFEGTYSGTYLIIASGQTFFAPVTVKVSVPKSGRVLTLVPSGFVSAPPNTFPIGGSLTLGSGKKAQLNSIFLIPTAAPSFGIGTFSGRKKKFNAVIVSQVFAQTAVSTANLAFSGKTLNLTLTTVVDPTTTFTVTINAKRKR